ncbi:hypothetical protein OAH46_00245 [Verrucomicrobia bacterium]|nr:hypothetical protein [Verrucomicrobiota bacterium]
MNVSEYIWISQFICFILLLPLKRDKILCITLVSLLTLQSVLISETEINYYWISFYGLLLGLALLDNRNLFLKLYIKKYFYWVVICSAVLFFFATESNYYLKYYACGLIVIFANSKKLLNHKYGKFILFALTFITFYGLSKYLPFFLISAIIRAKKFFSRNKVMSIIYITCLCTAFITGLYTSKYHDLEHYLEQRVFRENSQQGTSMRVFGFSDGMRYEIWNTQFNKIYNHEFLMGTGWDWEFYEKKIPNHNLILTLFMTFGYVGLVNITLIIFILTRHISKESYYLIIPFLVLSLIGEGVLVPLVFPLLCVLEQSRQSSSRSV